MQTARSIIDEAFTREQPSPALADYLRSAAKTWSGTVYHGTPVRGLHAMLANGIYGTQHGELAENDTLSTSLNDNVLSMFSEGDGTTGLDFSVNGIKLLVLDPMLTRLAIERGGSGMIQSLEDEDFGADEFNEFCERYQILPKYHGEYAFPYDYLSGIGIDAVVYEYTWDRNERGSGFDRDESEICFLAGGIEKLNHCIDTIYVCGKPYEASDRASAIADMEERMESGTCRSED